MWAPCGRLINPYPPPTLFSLNCFHQKNAFFFQPPLETTVLRSSSSYWGLCRSLLSWWKELPSPSFPCLKQRPVSGTKTWYLVLQQPYCNHEVTRQKAKHSRKKYGSLVSLLNRHLSASSESLYIQRKSEYINIFSHINLYMRKINHFRLFGYSVICNANIPTTTSNSASRNLS